MRASGPTRACQRAHACVPACPRVRPSAPTHACQRGHACVPLGPRQRAHACVPAGQRARARAPRVRAIGHTRACQRAHECVPAGTRFCAPPAFPSTRPPEALPPPNSSQGSEGARGHPRRGPVCAPMHCAIHPRGGEAQRAPWPKPRRVCMAMRDLALPQPRPGAARHRIKSTPCGTRTRNLRIRGPTPCPLGQGGCADSAHGPAYTSLSERMGRRIVHINGPTRA